MGKNPSLNLKNIFFMDCFFMGGISNRLVEVLALIFLLFLSLKIWSDDIDGYLYFIRDPAKVAKFKMG